MNKAKQTAQPSEVAVGRIVVVGFWYKTWTVKGRRIRISTTCGRCSTAGGLAQRCSQPLISGQQPTTTKVPTMKTLLVCSVLFVVCYSRPEATSAVSKSVIDKVKLEIEGAAAGRSLEDKFKSIHTKDSHECIPRLLCEMAATAKTGRLSLEESSILAVFASNTTTPDKTGKVPLNWYKFATDIGSNGKEADRCQTNFDKCPLAGEQLLTVFKAIVIKP